MAIRVLIEALLGGPSVSTTTSESTSSGDGKGGGARVWIKNKLKAVFYWSIGFILHTSPGLVSPSKLVLHPKSTLPQSEESHWLAVN